MHFHIQIKITTYLTGLLQQIKITLLIAKNYDNKVTFFKTVPMRREQNNTSYLNQNSFCLIHGPT